VRRAVNFRWSMRRQPCRLVRVAVACSLRNRASHASSKLAVVVCAKAPPQNQLSATLSIDEKCPKIALHHNKWTYIACQHHLHLLPKGFRFLNKHSNQVTHNTMSPTPQLSAPGSSIYSSGTMYVGDGTWDSQRNTFLLPNLQGLNFNTMRLNGRTTPRGKRNARLI